MSTTERRRPNTVSFADEVEAKIVENLTSDKSISTDLYYSSSEIQSFKLQTARTARSIQSLVLLRHPATVNIQDTSPFCGLEGYLTPTTTQEVTLRRRAHCRAVMREQLRQRLRRRASVDETLDPVLALANTSRVSSDWARRRGHAIGAMHVESRPGERSSGRGISDIRSQG